MMDEKTMAEITAWLKDRGYSSGQIDTPEKALICIWQEISADQDEGPSQ